eukprot:5114444-Alexandrium_andersonii.AAC.1
MARQPRLSLLARFPSPSRHRRSRPEVRVEGLQAACEELRQAAVGAVALPVELRVALRGLVGLGSQLSQ